MLSMIIRKLVSLSVTLSFVLTIWSQLLIAPSLSLHPRSETLSGQVSTALVQTANVAGEFPIHAQCWLDHEPHIMRIRPRRHSMQRLGPGSTEFKKLALEVRPFRGPATADVEDTSCTASSRAYRLPGKKPHVQNGGRFVRVLPSGWACRGDELEDSMPEGVLPHSQSTELSSRGRERERKRYIYIYIWLLNPSSSSSSSEERCDLPTYLFFKMTPRNSPYLRRSIFLERALPAPQPQSACLDPTPSPIL